MQTRNQSIPGRVLLAALPFLQLQLPFGHSRLDPIMGHHIHQGDAALAFLAKQLQM